MILLLPLASFRPPSSFLPSFPPADFARRRSICFACVTFLKSGFRSHSSPFLNSIQFQRNRASAKFALTFQLPVSTTKKIAKLTELPIGYEFHQPCLSVALGTETFLIFLAQYFASKCFSVILTNIILQGMELRLEFIVI